MILEKLKSLDKGVSFFDLAKMYETPEEKEKVLAMEKKVAEADPFYNIRTSTLKNADPTFSFAKK